MKWLLLIVTALALPACEQVESANLPASEDGTYNLVRSSTAGPMRIHVATFDADVGELEENRRYNSENCQIAKGLFEGQLGVRVLYACEEGRFDG